MASINLWCLGLHWWRRYATTLHARELLEEEVEPRVELGKGIETLVFANLLPFRRK